MDPVELWLIIGWLAITGIGLMLTSALMYMNILDLRFLAAHDLNGDLERVTKLSMWQEARRFVVKVFLFAIGVETLFQHPHPHPPRGAEWIGVVALFLIVGLLNYSSFAAIRFRRNFIRGTYQAHGEKGVGLDA
jgi:hypothetical protein